jgi:uroporphyrinogen decarboxylase
MDKFARIRATLSGEDLGELPVSLWHHFPVDDLHAERLVEKEMAFQERFDSDFMKFSPSGAYPYIAFGAEVEYYPSVEEEVKATGVYDGVSRVTKNRINSLDDWETLEEIDVNSGVLGEMLKAVRLIGEGLDGRVPFIETMFSPMTICQRLAGDRWRGDLREAPEKVSIGLEVVSRTMKEFSRASIEHGASGIFLSVTPTHDWFSEKEYNRFGVKYDVPILEATGPKAWFNVVHIHGNDIMFDLVSKNYPAQGVNWADKRTPPSLGTALMRTDKVLIGGLGETETLMNGSPNDVEEEVRRSASETRGRRLIIAPGCVIPLNTPEANLDAVIRAARNYHH